MIFQIIIISFVALCSIAMAFVCVYAAFSDGIYWMPVFLGIAVINLWSLLKLLQILRYMIEWRRMK